MFWYLLFSVSLVIIGLSIIVKLIQFSLPTYDTSTKIKKDDSAICLVALELGDMSPIKTNMSNHQGNMESELRQRPHHHITLDLSNLPRPNQLSTHSNQNTERRGSGQYCVVHSSSMRWQKLNADPPMHSQCKHVALDLPTAPVTSDIQYDYNPMGNVSHAPRGVGLRGTKPLITINRLDLLGSPKNINGNISDDLKHPSPRVTPRKSPSPREDSFSFATLSLQDLKIDIVIGGGGFGQVWRGSWNGTPVAVKILNAVCQNTVPSSVINDFEEEIRLLARLRHPNICMFLGACLEPPNRAIVTELVTRGTLWDLLRKPGLFSHSSASSMMMPMQHERNHPFHWPVWVTRKVFEGTTRGLIYLHNQDIIHRDLKSANLLLDDSFNIKICDFGLARLKDFTTVMTAQVGTVQWMSPEVIAGKAYEESADIYSLGIVMWETLTGSCPFDGMSQIDVAMSVVQKGMRPTIPNTCNAALVNILRDCWNFHPTQRPTAIQVLTALDSALPP